MHFLIENLVLPRLAGSSMGQSKISADVQREGRDRLLCLGFLCLKIQITSTKLQINLKFQYSMTKTFNDKTLFGFSNFGHWNLFDIWDLIFGISINQ